MQPTKPITTYAGKIPAPVPMSQQRLEATKARLLAEAGIGDQPANCSECGYVCADKWEEFESKERQ